SELLGRALAEPFDSYADSLICDRAIIGGWPRSSEPIKPYTTAETMNAGWCWQIEHEHWINRGYVFSSRHLSDEEAAAEFLGQNPLIKDEPRIVRFRTGRYRRAWVQNVVAIGNACGFVEPLEATALTAITEQCRTLAQCLHESFLEPAPGMRDLHNQFVADNWDEIRDFIALHYKFNSRLETPFWRVCREEIKLHTVQPLVDFYQENGPTAFHSKVLLRPLSSFGMEGYLAMLVGQKVPHAKPYTPPADELAVWNRICAENAARARGGLTVQEGLEVVRRVAAR
ncbi:MAG: tryptophan 7-halogenase, partial [Chthoniobacteraceae bacterium]